MILVQILNEQEMLWLCWFCFSNDICFSRSHFTLAAFGRAPRPVGVAARAPPGVAPVVLAAGVFLKAWGISPGCGRVHLASQPSPRPQNPPPSPPWLQWGVVQPVVCLAAGSWTHSRGLLRTAPQPALHRSVRPHHLPQRLCRCRHSPRPPRDVRRGGVVGEAPGLLVAVWSSMDRGRIPDRSGFMWGDR